MSQPLFNPDSMMEQAADDTTLARELADVFLGTSDALVADMLNSLQQSHWSELARASHTLKSPLGFFGATESVAIAQMIEDQADAGGGSELTEQVEALRQNVERLQAELREYFRQSEEGSP